MELQTKKILVTGADGFIGSHLTEELVRLGAHVRAFVFYNSFNSWGWLDHSTKEIKQEIEVFAGDVRDPYGVRKAVRGCDVVFHLAALIGIPYSYHSPDAYVDTNIKGTLNILQAAKELGAEKVVHTSTSEVYGSAKFVPITEEHPLQGQSPYAATKIGADQMAISFFLSFSTPVSIVRPFNTYGPRQSARAIIPTVITQLLSGKKTIRLGSLSPTRDFNYIEDTVQGFLAVGRADNVIGEVINIGSNFETSIGNTARVIGELIGVDFRIESDLVRVRPEKSEVERLKADNTKAKAMTGWEPAYGGVEGLKEGLRKTIAWFRHSENLRLYKHDIYNL